MVPIQTLVFLSVKTVGNRIIQLSVANFMYPDIINKIDLIILSIIERWHSAAKKMLK